MKTKILAVYDYGTGGIWCYIYARSANEIIEKYPELEIMEAQPEWMNGDVLRNIEENLTFDIDEPPKAFLLTLKKNRNGSGTDYE